MAYLFEQNTWFHLFPIDGRPHNKGIGTWFGDSVGHFDGDTLVIETVELQQARPAWTPTDIRNSDQVGAGLEKWNRRGFRTRGLRNGRPRSQDAYTQDWKIIDDSAARQFKLNNNQHIMEYSCEENNKALYEGRIKPPKYEDN